MAVPDDTAAPQPPRELSHTPTMSHQLPVRPQKKSAQTLVLLPNMDTKGDIMSVSDV